MRNASLTSKHDTIAGNTKLAVLPAVADEARPAITPPQGDRGFLTTSELQKTVLPYSRRAIFDLRRKGIIPSISFGAKVLYHKDSVIAALLRRQNGGADQ
jgi:hypothetical protein